jgi:hypothetical protein
MQVCSFLLKIEYNISAFYHTTATHEEKTALLCPFLFSVGFTSFRTGDKQDKIRQCNG